MTIATPAKPVTQLDTSNAATALSKRQQQPGIAGYIARLEPEIALALPKHLNAERIARIALTVVRRTPGLEKCTPESFAGALLTCAQLGLEPGATGEAYLVPYGTECTLIIGYQGMVKLFWQSPLAKSLDVQAVYENDEFSYELGLHNDLVHKPATGERGNATHFYATAELTTGGIAFLVMSVADIDKVRRRSRAKDNGPWKTDFDEMAKKTVLRRFFKILPKSTQLAQAMARDGEVRTDYDQAGIDAPSSWDEDATAQGDADVSDAEIIDEKTGEVLPVEDPPAGAE